MDDGIEDPHGFFFLHDDMLAGPQPLDLVLRQVAVRAVEVAVHQAEHARVDLDHRAELDLIQRIVHHVPAEEMVLEARRLPADGRVVALELEGAGARIVLREPRGAEIAVRLVGLHQFGVEDVDFRHGGEEDGRRFGEVEDHGLRVRRLGRARRDRALEERIGTLLHRQDAVDGIDDVGGFHRRAVMELRVPEREGVGEAVFRNVDFLGQPRLQVRGIVEPAHQAVIEVDARRDPSDIEDGVRVQRVVGGRIGENELAAGCCRGRCRAQRDRRGGGETAKTGCMASEHRSSVSLLRIRCGGTGPPPPLSRPFAGRHRFHWKPSMVMSWPVTKQGSTVARKATSSATSRGLPVR